jgi:hypothetical protein
VSIVGELRFAVRKWKIQSHHEGHEDHEDRKIILGLVGRRPLHVVCGRMDEWPVGSRRGFGISENLNPVEIVIVISNPVTG